MSCPIGFDAEGLRARVGATYARVALEPSGDFHFHRGLDYACDVLLYDREELRTLPPASTARFAGVGNPHRIGRVAAGEAVLDIGCGAGMDLLLSARRAGPGGRAIGVDPTLQMRDQAEAAAREAGLSSRVEVRAGHAEDLPLEDASVDVVQSNGVLNLAADKERAFREIRRVLRPGGRLLLADVVIRRELHLGERLDVDLWAGCVAGALLEEELAGLAAAAGLRDGRVVERFDCYRGTAVETKVSPVVGVRGANFFARG